MGGTQVFYPRSKKTTPEIYILLLLFQKCCWKALGCSFLSAFTYTQKSTLQEWGTWSRKLYYYKDYQGVRKPKMEPVLSRKHNIFLNSNNPALSLWILSPVKDRVLKRKNLRGAPKRHRNEKKKKTGYHQLFTKLKLPKLRMPVTHHCR